MKYVDEYRDGELAKKIAARIRAEADPKRQYHFMEFCGGHTHAISRYGVKDLLPPNVVMVHGPGCPVCVLPIGRIDAAIDLAIRHRAILCTYADTMRVPASGGLSLMKAKAKGADIRMVYSASDALQASRVDEPGARSGVPRHRLRDHDPAHRAGGEAGRRAQARQLHRVLQPRAHAFGHRPHPRIARSARSRHGGDRRFRGTCARLDDHRQPALRILRRGVRASRWSSPASSRST